MFSASQLSVVPMAISNKSIAPATPYQKQTGCQVNALIECTFKEAEPQNLVVHKAQACSCRCPP